MTTVHQLPTPTEAVTLQAAAAAFLDTFSRPEQAGTHRTYAAVLTHLLRAPLPGTDPVGMLDHPALAAQLADWFAQRWGAAGAATWNRNLACLRSACAYWRSQHWLTTDPTAGLARAKLPPARTRARSRTAIADLLTRPDLALRQRTLWALLYESAARAQEILLLDVTDLDRPNRRAVVHRKGGAVDEITWQTRTARLLARYLAGRTRGPVFLTDRAARVQLATTDLDPDTGPARLSYRRAAELFTQTSGGWTLPTCGTPHSPTPQRTGCPPPC
jgi:integrase